MTGERSTISSDSVKIVRDVVAEMRRENTLWRTTRKPSISSQAFLIGTDP